MWLLALALLPVVFGNVYNQPNPGNANNQPHPGNVAIDEYYDILGTGHKDYRLVFRGTPYIRNSVYTAYQDGSNIPPNVPEACKKIDWNAPCNSHYRNNAALNNWQNVEEVLFGIVYHGALVKILRFHGLGTTYMNWFGRDYYEHSCWEDLKYQTTSYFSIEGDTNLRRRFFINHKYLTCPNDNGWFVAVDQSNSPCPWEKGLPYPIFKFASGPTMAVFNNTPPAKTVKNADAIAVFVKYLPGKADEYFDILGTGKKEWRLAFRGTAGVGASVYSAYINGAGIPSWVEPGCNSTNYYAPCNSHYRNNDALDHWEHIDQVLLGLVYRGEIVKIIIFKGKSTTYTSWLNKNGVLQSCWSDLTTASDNFFSIQGDSSLGRRFFMNHQYDGCPKDAGWLVAVDTPSKPCPWEVKNKYPQFLFAAGPTLENWSTGHVWGADALVVFLKYKCH
ncbi:hemicentin-1 [Plakobranchus ocellatus]|uniref:Hemicentin-1 n=1 Tax=Plakobranchus ocellatus TaxID=259542 RepID=A0AAV4A5J4_9GAST|nr:hemicentin-1 [Plakobranchus ocellatus]